MFTSSALRIEIHRAGTVTALEMQDDRALIGSGSHCDVRLAPDEAAVEQLLVEMVGDDVYIKTRSLRPPCRLNGAPFLEGRVVATSMVEFSGLGICVSSLARSDSKVAQKRSGQSTTSPGMQLLGLMTVGLGIYAVLNPSVDGDGIQLAAVLPPALRLGDESCPQREPQSALALALQLHTEANTKRERAPFYAGDALTGAPLFERAARCFEAAGDPESAADAHESALLLQAQTGDQLHLAHVRIERNLAEEKFDEARRNAESALALVADPAHPYAQWLQAVKREGLLRAQSGAKK